MVFVCQSESPGPGTYDCFTSTEVNCPSFSKRGTTGFVPSKVRKSTRYHLETPLGIYSEVLLIIYTSKICFVLLNHTFCPNGALENPYLPSKLFFYSIIASGFCLCAFLCIA